MATDPPPVIGPNGYNTTVTREQRSLPLTSPKRKLKLSQALRWSRLSHILYDTWIPELLALCLSLVSLATIGIVVFVYSGHEAPTLPQRISLNAIVSILATISESTLIFTVSTCISQLKWPWYHVQRSLNDLQILDDASRGPLGSAIMITRIVRSTASMGALITVLALATDPFLQQLIAYPVKQVSTNSKLAQMKRATVFGTKSTSDPFPAAINAGIWSEPSMQNPVCPTGNCTWPGYTSLVWCSKCEDRTQNAVLRDCGLEEVLNQVSDEDNAPVELPCQVELADGHVIKTPMTISSRNGSLYSLSSSQWIVAPVSTLPNPGDPGYIPDSEQSTKFGDYLYTSESYLGFENPMLALGYASFDLGPGDSIYTALPFNLSSAQECVIDLCFANYAVTVSKGQAKVNATRTQPAAQFQTKLPVLWPSDLSNLNTTYHCWRQPDTPEAELTFKSIFNSTYSEGTCGVWVDAQGRAFCLEVGDSNCFEYVWAQEISKRLAFNVLHEYTFSPGNNTDATPATSDLVHRIFDYGLENITTNIAASLTNLAWSQPLTNQYWITAESNDQRNPYIIESLDVVYGQATSSVTYVKARFEWMILPVLLEIATGVLLTLTIIGTKKRAGPMWKGSILALLACGLKEDSSEFVARRGDIMTVPEIEEQAEEMNVCLRITEKGYGFAHDSGIEQQRDLSSGPATTSIRDPQSDEEVERELS